MTEFGIIILLKLPQFPNVLSLIIFIDEGKEIDPKLLHAQKASLPIETTDVGIEILFNLSHSLKEYFQIESILEGIIIDFKNSQALNIPVLIFFIFLGISKVYNPQPEKA